MGQDAFDDIDFGCEFPLPRTREILSRLAWHFLGPIPAPADVLDRHGRIRLLCQYAREAEWWFKGEMMPVFDKLSDERALNRWWVEVGYTQGDGRCDFVIDVSEAEGSVLSGIEVKVAYVGPQGPRFLDGAGGVAEGPTEPLGVLFPVNPGTLAKPEGLYADALRLVESHGLDGRFCMLFSYGEAKKLQDRAVQRLEDRLNELSQGRFKASALAEHHEPVDIAEGFAFLVATFEIAPAPCQ